MKQLSHKNTETIKGLTLVAYKKTKCNEKKIRFYTADEKLCEYEKFIREKTKNRDKLIQSGTLGQHT